MAYVRIWLHCVWGTKNRFPFLTKEIKMKVINHIREYATKKDIYIDFINGCKDHLHTTISLNAEQNISKVMGLLKGESSSWINKQKLTPQHFGWADEYFAVSVGESQINRVREYIKNQETHHQIRTWAEEYNEFMEKYGFAKVKG